MFDPSRFLQSRWGMMHLHLRQQASGDGLAGLRQPLRMVSDLKATLTQCGGRPAVLVEMPPLDPVPDDLLAPIRVFLIALVQSGPGASRYFTLEQTFNDANDIGAPRFLPEGLLCEVGEEGHSTTGLLVPPDGSRFLAAVQGLLENGPGALRPGTEPPTAASPRASR